ncbi:hypothetical protein PR202_gb16477 [Eleusine coracana subsp. coracana]|uniref:EF-hand domain-containing protein n=1 Tax=Eleusine coracana subsp. coracana TaxID=191504 RepID=A0AAV5F281_ELECO|nr:hypothetical protein PR202_gb16477 [Eleusine coracana subsp. coracana]
MLDYNHLIKKYWREDFSSLAGASYPPPAGAGYPPYAPPSPYNPAPYGCGGMFAALTPSTTFVPGTDPTIVACFQAADRDRSGMIDDRELQAALSGYSYQSFSLRTVLSNCTVPPWSNLKLIKTQGIYGCVSVQSLQNWRAIFERFDRDRSGKIDAFELRDALLSLGYSVSPTVLELLVSKFDKTGGKCRAIEYDNFIKNRCCLTVEGLTEKFKEKGTAYSGSANFSYETFMLTVLPFLVALNLGASEFRANVKHTMLWRHRNVSF